MAFSDLLKLFTSAFGTAQFLPCALATLAGTWGLPLLIDRGDPLQLLDKLQPLDTSRKLGVALGGAIVLSVVFKILDKTQVRFYSGYLPSRTFWRPLLAWQRAKRRRSIRTRDRLDEIPRGRRTPDEQRRLDDAVRRLQYRHAREERFTLATRLGNVFRAFEGYPNERYKFDGVTMWPRIQPFLPEASRQAVSSAQSDIDLLLTSATLLWTATVLVVRLEPPSLDTLLVGGGTALAAYLCYSGAVISGVSQGLTVRACFDIGRDPLLKALGMELPKSLEEERALWRKVTRFFLFNEGDGGRPSAETVAPEEKSDQSPSRLALGAAAALFLVWIARRLRRK